MHCHLFIILPLTMASYFLYDLKESCKHKIRERGRSLYFAIFFLTSRCDLTSFREHAAHPKPTLGEKLSVGLLWGASFALQMLGYSALDLSPQVVSSWGAADGDGMSEGLKVTVTDDTQELCRGREEWDSHWFPWLERNQDVSMEAG